MRRSDKRKTLALTDQIRFDDVAAYERYMGEWSRLAGETFLDWLAPKPGLRWLDVGCGNGAFTEALGLSMDGSKFGMGTRGQRFSMVVNDGVVEQLNVEEPGAFNVSSADYMLERL